MARDSGQWRSAMAIPASLVAMHFKLLIPHGSVMASAGQDRFCLSEFPNLSVAANDALCLITFMEGVEAAPDVA